MGGSVAAFLLTGVFLGLVQGMVDPPMLMAERLVRGAGWAEVPALAVYSGWLVSRMRKPALAVVWRRRVWRLFSVVFFGQLLLGLAGFGSFLMTGRLHFPIPALIVAGPAYRGTGFFMLFLFLSTVVLVGPAWCSHLCYVGSWDDLAAARKKRPVVLPRWTAWGKVAMAGLIVAAAFVLGRAGFPAWVATAAAASLGILSVGVILSASRATGVMVHCTVLCPIGVLATRLGRLNPFRISIDAGCTDCGVCTPACRYDALSRDDVRMRRPGPSCTLCGDCINSCRSTHLRYRFPGLSSDDARTVFLVLVVSLHAVFLGLARI